MRSRPGHALAAVQRQKHSLLASSAEGSSAGSYQIDTSQGPVHTRSVVVATGGLSIPKIGATDLGYRLAQQFNIPLVERAPAWCRSRLTARAGSPMPNWRAWHCRCRSAPAAKGAHGV